MTSLFKKELQQQRIEINAIFRARLNKMASTIRKHDLSPSESADLLDAECEELRRQVEDLQ